MIEKQLLIDARFPLPARRLDALVGQLLRVNKRQATAIIHDGGARVNGRYVRRPATVLDVGDRLEVSYEPVVAPPTQAASPRHDPQSLEVVYEDDDLLVVDKPPELLTVPSPHREKVTLIALLNRRLQARDRAAQAYCVHRLDRGVSGLLVFAKSLEVAEALRSQFAERKPQRLYAAIVAGELTDEAGTYRSHLATDQDLNRYSTTDENAGQLAITHYRVLRRWPEATLVEVRLETGRRNQIRVHFAEAGHPVLGDPRYGQGRTRPRSWPFRRLALQALSLGFTHPRTGEPLRFSCPLCEEMRCFAPIEPGAKWERRNRPRRP